MAKKIWLIILLLWAIPCFGQSLCTVTGNVKNLAGSSAGTGTIYFSLANYTGPVYVTGTGMVVPKSVTGAVKTDGSFSVQIWGNDTLSPANTLYDVRIAASDGVFEALYSITGATFDLNSAIPTGTPSAPVFTNTVSSAVTYSGNNTFTGNNTHSGTETFNGPLNENAANTGNVASKNGSADAVRYVTTAGSDSNDGLSWGSAKATIAAAVAALPTCAPVRSSNGGNPSNSFSGPCGTVFLGSSGSTTASGYPVSTTLTINSVMVRIVGTEMLSSVIQCSISPCIQISGSGAGSPNPVMNASGGLENVTIANNGLVGGIGLDAICAAGIIIRDTRISGFTGAGGTGLKEENDTTGCESERVELQNVAFDNNTRNVYYTVAGGGAVSFNHQKWQNVNFSLGNGQTAIAADQTAQVTYDLAYGVINTLPPNTNTYTGISLSGTASIAGFLGYRIDNGAGGTMTPTSGATATNFQVYGWDSNNTQNFNTQDRPISINTTASNAFNGLTFLASGVAKQYLYIDGSNFLGVHNGTQENFAISSANGGGWWANGSSGGATNFIPAASASPVINGPTSSGTETVTIASGTATMTTALIAAGACGTTVTVASSGVATTDAIQFSFNAAVGANPGVLNVHSWPTANNVNFVYCNPTAAGVTPSAATLNWRVVR